MDNVTLDVGPEPRIAIGDRVTVIGADGEEKQTAEQLAQAIGTINYEVVCGISSRVPREYHRDGGPHASRPGVIVQSLQEVLKSN